jgi:4-diphosphocytidyl-2-C-methyl-D-erythritol kinase
MYIWEKAHAKINLFLGIKGRRPDGYHEIETVFQSLALHDVLRLETAADGGLSLSVSDSTLPVGPENLAWRAAALFKKHYGVTAGIKIHLVKKIPVAAGLGGGSSDAAAVLRGLCRLWRLRPARDDLCRLAADLGSDVPFCLEGGTALGRGRGEILERLAPLTRHFVVLANPGYHLSTASVYAAYCHETDPAHPGIEPICIALEDNDRERITGLLFNSLEAPAFRLRPDLIRFKAVMAARGAALLCGSGPTVFALFSHREEALSLYKELSGMGINARLTETRPGEKLEVL